MENSINCIGDSIYDHQRTDPLGLGLWGSPFTYAPKKPSRPAETIVVDGFKQRKRVPPEPSQMGENQNPRRREQGSEGDRHKKWQNHLLYANLD